MDTNLNTTITPKPTKRGKQTQVAGKNFEKFFFKEYSFKKVEEMNFHEKVFFKKLMQNHKIRLFDISYIHIQGNGSGDKSDGQLSVLQKNHDCAIIKEGIQFKSSPESVQFLIGSVINFTAIFKDKYPNAAIAFEKIVGHGIYAEEARKNDCGGYVEKNINGNLMKIKYNYRYLISELTLEERKELKGLSEDKEIFMKMVKYILQGDKENKPTYCVFPLEKCNTNVADLRVLKYEDLFEALEYMFDQGLGHQMCNIPTGNIPKKYNTVGIKMNEFNIKMKDAGKDDSHGHQLQVMGNVSNLYKIVENYKLTIATKKKQSLTVANKN